MASLPDPTNKKKKKDLQERRAEEMTAEYITSLRQRIKDLEELADSQHDLLRAFERGERRMRVWSIAIACAECGKNHEEYVALVNRKTYQGSDYKKLVQRLRMMGYLIKETAFSEKPPTDGPPTETSFDYLKMGVDLRDIPIPEGVPPNIMEGIEE